MTTPLQLTGETAVDSWESFHHLPCRLSVRIRLPHFSVGDLKRLQPGSVVKAGSTVTADVPVWVNGANLGWGEFETLSGKLAVRITRLV